MTKKMKKLLGVVSAVVIMSAMSIAALAASDSRSYTINGYHVYHGQEITINSISGTMTAGGGMADTLTGRVYGKSYNSLNAQNGSYDSGTKTVTSSGITVSKSATVSGTPVYVDGYMVFCGNSKNFKLYR